MGGSEEEWRVFLSCDIEIYVDVFSQMVCVRLVIELFVERLALRL